MSERAPNWGISPVPERLRTLGALENGMLWSSLGLSLLVLVAGAFLVPGLSLPQALLAILVGGIFGNALLGFAAAIGAEAGVPAMVLLRAPLGRAGSYLPTGLNVLQNLGWTIFEVLVIATAARALVHGPLWAWKLAAAAAATILALVGPIGFVREWVTLVALGVDETKEPFANVYSAAVSLQNVLPRVPQRLLILAVAGIATAGTFVVNLVHYQDFLYLLGSFFVPLFGVLLAQWLAGNRDAFGAPEIRPAQIVAWLAGFCLYQWLAPVGPASWIHLVDHTHPGQGAIGGSLPSFALAFVLSIGLTLASRATARRDRPSVA